MTRVESCRHSPPSFPAVPPPQVRIKLPGARGKDLDLDVQRQRLTLLAPAYKLALYLPHPVDDKQGKAKWDAEAQVLSVELPVIRKEVWED